MRNGSARDACLPGFTTRLGQEQFLPQACFNTHGTLSQVSSLTVADYRPLLADLAVTLLCDLAAEQVSLQTSKAPSLSLMLHYFCRYSIFMTAEVEPKALTESESLCAA